MPYTFLGAPVSQKVMRWPTDQQSRARALLEAEMFLIVNMKVYCVFSLESPHRGDSEYTSIPFSI